MTRYLLDELHINWMKFVLQTIKLILSRKNLWKIVLVCIFTNYNLFVLILVFFNDRLKTSFLYLRMKVNSFLPSFVSFFIILISVHLNAVYVAILLKLTFINFPVGIAVQIARAAPHWKDQYFSLFWKKYSGTHEVNVCNVSR